MKNGLIYLDNAATSYPKPKNVINAVSEALLHAGNPGRSGHELSLYSARAVYKCREAICNFLKFSNPENVVFTYNTTYAINIALKGLYKGGEIIISNLEHNSVLRPVFEACGGNYKVFDALGNDEDILASFENAITSTTAFAVVTMCSNVTGKILPFKKIAAICKKRGIKLIFDAAQCAGIIPLDLSDLYFSAVCFAGHKSLYGIMGCGFCIFSKDVVPVPIIQGGNGVESISIKQAGFLPEKLESGTVGVPSIVALYEGIRHINTQGIGHINEKCRYLEKRVTEGLLNITGIDVIGICDNKVSTVLFNVKNTPSEEVAEMLSAQGICTRAGLHCAPLAHKALGTIDSGAVRVSLSHFNDGKDIESFLSQIEKIAKI